MMCYAKIHLEAYINTQYICLKNNIAQFYSILGRVELRLKFSNMYTWLRLISCWKICGYQSYPQETGNFQRQIKAPNMCNIIVQSYFLRQICEGAVMINWDITSNRFNSYSPRNSRKHGSCDNSFACVRPESCSQIFICSC